MKNVSKILGVALVGAIALSACSKNEVTSENIVKLSVSTENCGTKTYLSTIDGVTFNPMWSGNEKLEVWFDNLPYTTKSNDLNNGTATLSASASGVSTTFTGSASLDANPHTMYGIIANTLKKSYKDGIRADVAATQTPVYSAEHGYSIDPKADVLIMQPQSVSVSDNNASISNARFTRVNSILRFKLNASEESGLVGLKVKDFTFKAGKEISGGWKINLETGELMANMTNASSGAPQDFTVKSTDLSSANAYIGTENNVLMYSVLAEELVGELTITGTCEGEKAFTWTKTLEEAKKVTIESGEIYTFNITLSAVGDGDGDGDGDDEPELSYEWSLTSTSDDWKSSDCVTYFSQPYGMKKANAYIVNKSIDAFSLEGLSSIKCGVKCLQNGATTSILTIYLVDASGNTIGSGIEVTPINQSAASKTDWKYATFTTGLTNATGFMVKCTTFGKNILINGASYEVTK